MYINIFLTLMYTVHCRVYSVQVVPMYNKYLILYNNI